MKYFKFPAFFCLSVVTCLSPTTALPQNQRVQYFPFDTGQTNQLDVDVIGGYSSDYDDMISVVTYDGNTHVLSNQGNAPADDRYTKDYLATVYEYNFATGKWTRLGSSEEYCYKGMTASLPVENGGSFQVAGMVAGRSPGHLSPCTQPAGPVIWQESWKALPVEGFPLTSGERILPYAFARDKPQLLLGRITRNADELDIFTGLGVWQYDPQGKEYQVLTRIDFPSGYFTDALDQTYFSADGSVIEVSLLQLEKYSDPIPAGITKDTYRYVYNPQTKQYDLKNKAGEYNNFLIGHYPQANASLIYNIFYATGRYWFNNGSLPSDSRLNFDASIIVEELEGEIVLGLRSNSYSDDKGILFSSPTSTMKEPSAVYQQGVTEVAKGIPGFIPLADYLTNHCYFSDEDIKFEYCRFLSSMVISHVEGQYGYAFCKNPLRIDDSTFNATHEKPNPFGFYRIDLSPCPKAN